MRSGLIVLAIVILIAGAALLLRSRAEKPAAGRIVVVPSSERSTFAAQPAGPREAPQRKGSPTAGQDRAWAESSETLLRVQMRQVPMLDVGDNLQVSCGGTVCRVAARLPAGLHGDNRAMYWRFIQGPAVRERVEELGLPLTDAQLGLDDRFVLSFRKSS